MELITALVDVTRFVGHILLLEAMYILLFKLNCQIGECIYVDNLVWTCAEINVMLTLTKSFLSMYPTNLTSDENNSHNLIFQYCSGNVYVL